MNHIAKNSTSQWQRWMPALRSAVREAVFKGWESAATEEGLFFASVEAAVHSVQLPHSVTKQ